ncbi:hypothetical protein [Lactobacillus sp. ESL0703]|uniref:hypothetical protein n=1 Tax=Lactobacillus sp. ESL0703 TaxID=2983218 RepID=UPI0023F92AF1|nr:hypothetical protein [Lactobacillus sp. ESL0703]MDF7668499.1 hypothetical protein [Lactobacillus sp. ESL0703]
MTIGFFLLYPAYDNSRKKKQGKQVKYTKAKIWISGILGGIISASSLLILEFAINPPDTHLNMFENLFLFCLILSLIFLYPAFNLVKSYIQKKKLNIVD